MSEDRHLELLSEVSAATEGLPAPEPVRAPSAQPLDAPLHAASDNGRGLPVPREEDERLWVLNRDPLDRQRGESVEDFRRRLKDSRDRDLGLDAEGIEFAPELPHDGRRLRLRALAEVEARKLRWLVPGMIPLRTITLVAGVGGLGKSTYLAGVAAKVSSGRLLNETPSDVLIVTYEDPAAEVLRPRVEAALGDVSRVHEVVVDGFAGIDPVRLPADVGELEQLVHDVKAKLLIIDPIVAAIDTALDAHKDQHVRAVLSQLAQLADDADCAVAIVGHLNKVPSKDAYIRVANSVAFWNAARAVVLVTEDNGADRMRLVAQRKANWARLHPVERHRIEEIQLERLDPETGDPIVTSRMVFVEEANDVDAADVLGPPRIDDGDTRSDALRFLVAELAGGGWCESAAIKDRAEKEGIAERTLQRAREDLGVEHDRRGFPAVTYWRLPSRARGTHVSGGTTEETAWLSQNHGAESPLVPLDFGDTSAGTTSEERG